MPPVPVPPDDWFKAHLAGQARALQGLASQQQSTITNGIGQPVLNEGLSPGTSVAQYGLQMVNPPTGSEIGFLGEDADGNVALKFRNAGGQLQVQVDVNGLHFYDTSGNELVRIDSTGLHVYNASGTEEVAAGLINASPAIYGLGVLPYGGTELQQVGGSETSDAGGLSNTTVTSWTVPTGASTLTFEVGPSGAAEVTISGQCSTGTGGQEAYIGCLVDGATVPVTALVASGAGAVSLSTSATQVLTGLTPNSSHTFEPVVKTAANGSATCSFVGVTVTVTPL